MRQGFLYIVLLISSAVTYGAPFDRQWCILTTPQFEYLTDEPVDKARQTVEDLARFRQLFMQLLPEAQGDSGLPLKMVMFSRPNEFYRATGSRHFGGYTIPSLFEYRLLMTERTTSAATRVAYHEYAHYLLRNQTNRSYPLWYEEGLATYLSTAVFETDATTLGRLPRRRAPQTSRVIGEPSLEEVLAAVDVRTWPRRHVELFYDRAWRLVHFLRLGHQIGFDDYRPQLDAYLAEPTRDFAGVFGITPKSMNRILDTYRKRRRYGQETVAYQKAEPPIPTTRCLTDAERDFEIAVSITAHNPELARELLGSIDGDASASRLAALSRTTPEPSERTRLLREALTLEPYNADALIGSANNMIGQCFFINDEHCFDRWLEAATTYRQALRIDPSRFDAAFGLGVAYTHTGRAGDAMNYLQVAYNKAPWAPAINFYLGEGYRIIGDKRAATYLSNARNWATEEIWRQRAELALGRVP